MNKLVKLLGCHKYYWNGYWIGLWTNRGLFTFGIKYPIHRFTDE